MSKLIPEPSTSINITDNLYGELKSLPESIDFFIGEEYKVNTEKVEEKNKLEVEGLETMLNCLTSPILSSINIEGNESINFERAVNFIIQMAKDVVAYLLNLINNRLSRTETRQYRIKIQRKRLGIRVGEVNYPVGLKRLVVPLKMSIDPNWVCSSLDDVLSWYKKVIKAYNYLIGEIKIQGEDFYLDKGVSDIISGTAKIMGLSRNKNVWVSDTLPGNRVFALDEISNGDTGQIKMYFMDSTLEGRLLTSSFEPTGPLIDKTIDKLGGIIKEIKSNQSHVSFLTRRFEKEVTRFTSGTGISLTSNEKEFFSWLIRFNKRLMSMNIQYVISAVDSGLDFCNAGVAK